MLWVQAKIQSSGLSPRISCQICIHFVEPWSLNSWTTWQCCNWSFSKNFTLAVLLKKVWFQWLDTEFACGQMTKPHRKLWFLKYCVCVDRALLLALILTVLQKNGYRFPELRTTETKGLGLKKGEPDASCLTVWITVEFIACTIIKYNITS